jgi:hypothetical protein
MVYDIMATSLLFNIQNVQIKIGASFDGHWSRRGDFVLGTFQALALANLCIENNIY